MSMDRVLALLRFEDYLKQFGTPRILDRDGLVFVELISDKYLFTGEEYLQINEKFYQLTNNEASLFCLRAFRTFEASLTVRKRLCQDPPREGTLDCARKRASVIDIKISEIDDRYLMCGGDLFSEPEEAFRVFFVPNNINRDVPVEKAKYARMTSGFDRERTSDGDEIPDLRIASPVFEASESGLFFVDVKPRD